MTAFFQMTWVTLLGLSLLFVGGFVLWVYGTHIPYKRVDATALEAEATHKFHQHLVQWFFLYGILTVCLGLICLLAAIIDIL